MDNIIKKWRRLDPVSFKAFSAVRNNCHEALQILASTAISFIPQKTDDSHTNTEWSRMHKSLISNLFGKEKKYCLGLNMSELKLLFLKENWTVIEEYYLNNQTLEEVVNWLKKRFLEIGLDANKFSLDKHYEIPPKRIFSGAKFMLNDEILFSELSDYYSNADLILREYIRDLNISTPVRCWPHHFDIATLLSIGHDKLQSIGIGLSPGDSSSDEPYYYVTMWPYPDLDKVTFSKLSVGCWNNEGWIGAVLKASEIIKDEDEKLQFEKTQNFIESAVEKIKHAVLP